jgi:hypothetical protein
LIDIRHGLESDTDVMGEPVFLGDLRLIRDAAPGAWIVERAVGPWHTVGSMLPTGFGAYAEIFHPAYKEVADRGEAGEDARGIRLLDGSTVWKKEVTWAEVGLA